MCARGRESARGRKRGRERERERARKSVCSFASFEWPLLKVRLRLAHFGLDCLGSHRLTVSSRVMTNAQSSRYLHCLSKAAPATILPMYFLRCTYLLHCIRLVLYERSKVARQRAWVNHDVLQSARRWAQRQLQHR